MKRSYKHLPQNKQAELKLIIRELKKFPQVECVILFGSYAKGSWVYDVYEDPKSYITYEYHSDFDLMVLVSSETCLQRLLDFKDLIKKRIKKISLIPTPISFFVHDIAYVNRKLKEVQFFFSEVYREGILLFSRKNYSLTRPQLEKLSISDRLEAALNNFEDYMEASDQFYHGFEIYLKKKWNKLAAFNLHQAVENLYSTVHLVYTHYRPKLHDIEELGEQACGFDSEFSGIFPNSTEKEKRLFKLLKEAYVRARYDKTYRITQMELKSLAQRVRKLKRLTNKVCKAQIQRFKQIQKQDSLLHKQPL